MASAGTIPPASGAGLRFAPWTTAANSAFWTELARRKLEVWKLDESAVRVWASFVPAQHAGVPPLLNLSLAAFDKSYAESARTFAYYGKLVNCNTADAFRALDTVARLAVEAAALWRDIASGAVLEKPALLNRLVLFTFAELKGYTFKWLAATPALLPRDPAAAPRQLGAFQNIGAVYRDADLKVLASAFEAVRSPRVPAVLVVHAAGNNEIAGVARFTDLPQLLAFKSAASASAAVDSGSAANLAAAAAAAAAGAEPPSVVTVLVADPSSYTEQAGWPLQNVLFLLAFQLRVAGFATAQRVRVVLLRERQGRDLATSLVVHFDVTPLGADDVAAAVASASASTTTAATAAAAAAPTVVATSSDSISSSAGASATAGAGADSLSSAPTPYRVVNGFERVNGKAQPRFVNLADIMDPLQRAESAVSLNLHLIKWRIMPELNLDKIAASKCLLLGAGTLGCNVARGLLSWGVRHLTFVDAGKVSYSNPVRQSLFVHADCLDGGSFKAEAAARRCAEIFPAVTATSHVMTIPMPGHPLADSELGKTKEAFELLEKLVIEHDVIFLGTDTRESRWLPTLLAASHGKMLINSALGFDTYVVMRHGAAPIGSASEDGERLGCYFCNDVVAPQDSLRDRTLDQQCTVTRPASSALAGSLAVELFVSLLQHPCGLAAPSEELPAGGRGSGAEEHSTCLGIVPHQVRGFLARYEQLLLSGSAYPQCTACSWPLVEAFRRDGFALVQRACNEWSVLEELSGLAELKRRDAAADNGDWMNDGDDDDDDFAGDD